MDMRNLRLLTIGSTIMQHSKNCPTFLLSSMPSLAIVCVFNYGVITSGLLTLDISQKCIQGVTLCAYYCSPDTDQFKTRSSTSTPIPPPFQMTILRCERIAKATLELRSMSLQCLHISQVLLHLIFSLVDSDQQGSEELLENDTLQG
jgi:hypothetical protein